MRQGKWTLTFIFFAGTFGLSLSGRELGAFEGGIGIGGGGGGGGAEVFIEQFELSEAIAGGGSIDIGGFARVEFEAGEGVTFAALTAGAGGGGGGGGGGIEEVRGRAAGVSDEEVAESRTGFWTCNFGTSRGAGTVNGAGGAGGGGGGGGGGIGDAWMWATVAGVEAGIG